jgi:diketogulonate reductase-like aldo/keto reductase
LKEKIVMSPLQDTFTLNNGVKIPQIGFGTWQIPDGNATYDAVSFALANGYRHIDTALAYGNETSVGRAVRDSGIPRSEIFVTSKLPGEIKGYDEALAGFETTMRALQLEVLDLYLIHAPWPWEQMGEDFSAQNKDVWRAFEKIYATGRVRAIGVSNFEVADLASILDGCKIKPMVNQIKFFIGNTQNEIADFCHRNGIQIEGFSPLATGAILENVDVLRLAERYGKSVSQICIRYVLQKGVVALPKSTHPARILQNTDIGFEISSEDMAYLDGLTDTVSVHYGPKRK